MKMTAAQSDRAAGVLLGLACGDALGAGYEFGTGKVDADGPRMIGGGLGGFAPGEWTDDTSMALAIAEVSATGADLRTPEALDAIATGFLGWAASNPPDMGIQTSHVLRSQRRPDESPAEQLRRVSQDLHRQTGRTAGNGSLMRTAPVALAHRRDPAAILEAAIAVSDLTHPDPVAGQACAIWCLAIDHAIRTGAFEIRGAIDLVGAEQWHAWIDQAEAASSPAIFSATDGWVVSALQAAWCAIVRTPYDDCLQLQRALELICRTSRDTDTVAAIAGSLLGARWGASAIPFDWRRLLHGWPGLRARDVMVLGLRSANGDAAEWPNPVSMQAMPWFEAVPHPLDPDLFMGNLNAPADVEAVVSVCRLGSKDLRPVQVHHEVWLSDTDRAHNPNLDFVLLDAARAVAQLRLEGKRVLVHCAYGASRTPVVSALAVSIMTGTDFDEALAGACEALPDPCPNPVLVEAARGLVPPTPS